MTDPKVLKGVGYVLLAVALALIAVALLTEGNNMWTALAALVPAFAAIALFQKAEPERYKRKNKTS